MILWEPGVQEGNQTTIGFKEAEEVRSCYDYLLSKGEKKIYLFGTSLGAAAILKSIHDYAIDPAGIMIECPFGTLYQTTAARFNSLNVPSFPLGRFTRILGRTAKRLLGIFFQTG